MTVLLEATFNTILQIGLVLAVAALIWRFAARSGQGFMRWVGLVPCPGRAFIIGAAIGLAAAAVLLSIPAVRAVAISPGSVPGKALADGVSTGAVIALALLALFKTALAEELLFRGLIGKRLIARTGFLIGNSIQALLFGAIHLALLLSPEASIGLVLLMVAFSAVMGFVNGWLNERLGGGSILPGWAAHGAANLATYMAVAISLA